MAILEADPKLEFVLCKVTLVCFCICETAAGLPNAIMRTLLCDIETAVS